VVFLCIAHICNYYVAAGRVAFTICWCWYFLQWKFVLEFSSIVWFDNVLLRFSDVEFRVSCVAKSCTFIFHFLHCGKCKLHFWYISDGSSMIFLSGNLWDMFPMVRGSQESQGNLSKCLGKSENQEKSGNFTFQSQGKIRGSGKVRENQSTRVQKLTKMQKKVLNCFTHTAYNSSKFFSACFARRLFVSTLLNLFRFLRF